MGVVSGGQGWAVPTPENSLPRLEESFKCHAEKNLKIVKVQCISKLIPRDYHNNFLRACRPSDDALYTIGISQIVESDNYVILASEDEVTTPKYDPSEDFKNPLMDIIREKPIDENGPYFDMKENESNITGVVGDTIYLRCRVRNLGNRTVSWIRHRDIHLLAVGRYTYTSDQRFEAIHPPHTEEWAMKIKYPQRKDSGVYECQVSTIPPISFRINLNVKEAFTQIVGGPDLFIDNGSTINLTCLIDYTPQPPPDIIWKHGDQEINFDSPRGGISLVTVKGIPNTTSRLLIQKANTNDSGEYTCAPSNANPSSIRVHILNGEHPAAMHHGCGTVQFDSITAAAFILSVTLFLRWTEVG